MTNKVKDLFENKVNPSFYISDKDTDGKIIYPGAAIATRTVYMDSNIALTDGSDPVGTGENVNTIPNLYNAIQDIHTRIDTIDATHGPSTADAGLFVTSASGVITMSPTTFTDTDKQNATEGIAAGDTSTNSGAVFRISAPNIEFEVTSLNADGTTTAKLYKLGAIIEAIQELNRRTMFMDTAVPFTEGAGHETVEDGLPAASNGHIKVAQTP